MDTLLNEILTAARTCTIARDRERALIVDVFNALQGSVTLGGATLPEFKAWLVANARMHLSRCDLGLDAAKVAASEARYLNATFHFVRV